jgi:hypothetical protein
MRFYHPGAREDINPPTVNHPTMGRCITAPPSMWDTCPFTKVKIPKYVPAQPHSLALAIDDRFYVVPPTQPDGSPGFVDLPDYLPVKVVKNMAPHLLTEREARTAGLLDEKEGS